MFLVSYRFLIVLFVTYFNNVKIILIIWISLSILIMAFLLFGVFMVHIFVLIQPPLVHQHGLLTHSCLIKSLHNYHNLVHLDERLNVFLQVFY